MLVTYIPLEIRGVVHVFDFPRWVPVTIVLRPNGGYTPTLQIQHEKKLKKDKLFLSGCKMGPAFRVFFRNRCFRLISETCNVTVLCSSAESCRFWMWWLGRVGVTDWKHESTLQCMGERDLLFNLPGIELNYFHISTSGQVMNTDSEELDEE